MTASSWQVGAVMAAHVLSRHSDGRLTLRVDQEEVLTEVPLGAIVPRSFRVRVARGGTHPHFEVVEEVESEEASRLRALLSLVPKQSGLAALMAELQPVLDGNSSRFPSDIGNALAILDNAIPSPSMFANVGTAATTLGNAGLSLEGRLARALAAGSDAPLLRDWKAALARLSGALQQFPPIAAADARGDLPPPLPAQDLPRQPRAPRLPSPGRGTSADWGRLRHAAEGVLARIEIAQLQTQIPRPVWLLELPIRGRGGFDVLQIRIAPAAGERAAGDPPPWNITISMDLPALGAVGADITLVRGNRVRVALWAELSAVARRIESSLTALVHSLQAEGIIVEHAACRYGSPERPPAGSGGLLSATA